MSYTESVMRYGTDLRKKVILFFDSSGLDNGERWLMF